MNNMINIEVEKIIDPTPASDGAGVKLKRVLVLNQIIMIHF